MKPFFYFALFVIACIAIGQFISWWKREREKKADLIFWGNYRGPYLVESLYPGDPSVLARAEEIKLKLEESGNRWNVEVIPCPMNVVIKKGKIDKSLPNETIPEYKMRIGETYKELLVKYNFDYNLKENLKSLTHQN